MIQKNTATHYLLIQLVINTTFYTINSFKNSCLEFIQIKKYLVKNPVFVLSYLSTIGNQVIYVRQGLNERKQNELLIHFSCSHLKTYLQSLSDLYASVYIDRKSVSYQRAAAF